MAAYHAPLNEAYAIAGGSKDACICSSPSPFPCIIGPVVHLIFLQSKAKKIKLKRVALYEQLYFSMPCENNQN